MEDIERILAARKLEAAADYKILMGSAGVYLAFQDDPGTAYGVDSEGNLLEVPYLEGPELVE